MNWRACLLVALGIWFLVGCTSWSVPANVRTIELLRVPSAAVALNPLWWDSVDGNTVLKGSVEKQFEGPPTDGSHLHVRFVGAAGATLDEQLVAFSPQHLRRRSRPPHPRAEFAVAVSNLPAGTVRIEVRAHDEPHLKG